MRETTEVRRYKVYHRDSVFSITEVEIRGVSQQFSPAKKMFLFGLFLVNYVYRHTGCILAGVKPVDPVVNCMILPYDVHDLRIRFAALLFIMFVDSP